MTSPTRDEDYQVAVRAASSERGVCIRLGLDDVDRPRAIREVYSLLAHLSFSLEDTDLILDCGQIEEVPPRIGGTLSRLPDLPRWRTLTVTAGAFPKDLMGFKVSQHLYPRLDWLSWRAQVTEEATLPRVPTYGDYTIQHAIFIEPPERANFSASIRYTTDEHWLIMRGEGVFNEGGPGFGQWPANARLLIERPEFCGPEFSDGDRYVYEMGQQTSKTGNPESWLRAGINHHVTFVVRQISQTLCD